MGRRLGGIGDRIVRIIVSTTATMNGGVFAVGCRCSVIFRPGGINYGY